MPTLVITGHPCAGKTTFARILAKRAIAHPSASISSTIIVNEETSCRGKTKSECYANSKAEKVTREALKSDFDKCCTSAGDLDAVVGGHIVHRKKVDPGADGKVAAAEDDRKRLVILDSLNYIKGYRYEIHCIAKAAGQRHGIVWVLNDPEVCKTWNDNRREAKNRETNDGEGEDWYRDDAMIEELMQRYEPPDERNRWDKPLYRADVGSVICFSKANGAGNNRSMDSQIDEGGKSKSSTDAVLNRTLYDMHSLNEAIGASGTKNVSSSSKKTTPNAGAKSFKRSSAASGFKRNPSRSSKPTAAAASTSPRIGGALTLEALESLDASNATAQEGAATAAATTTPINEAFETHNNAAAASDSDSPEQNDMKVPKSLEELADSILDVFLGEDVVPLKGGKSTELLVNAGANVLHDVDIITQRIVTSLIAEQRSAAALGSALSGGKLRVTVGSDDNEMTVNVKTNRSVSVSELKRFRREFVKWLTAHPPEDTSEIGIATAFLSYVESQL